jgi:predicted nucleotidyltransferase
MKKPKRPRKLKGFKERLSRIPSYAEFGVDVSLVLLFGSYLCREPEVRDIDIGVLTTRRELRQKGEAAPGSR